MRFNFKKISAIGSSVLLAGMTMGFASAVSIYPAPFVSGGTADVAIVYGTGSGVSSLDLVQAGNIQSNLQSFMGSGSGSTTVSTSGEIISLDTSATRIWLNTSLNTARSSLTKNDLAVTLADTTFSGNAEAKLTHSIKLLAGAAAGGTNSGRVIFAKQPKSSNDPVVGVSLGSSATSNPLYNASVTFSKTIAFNNSESEGEEITLFGQKFTVSSDTDGTDIVLLKEAETISLSNEAPTATVTIGGATYTVEFISSSDTAASIRVTDSSGGSNSAEINEADSKKIQGLEVAVKTADETNLKLSATLIVGAQKVTFTDGATVTTGSDNDPIDGTTAYISGGPSATTEIAIAVFRPSSSEDSINAGETFEDPVFGSFKMEFNGLSNALEDTGRDMISVGTSGDDTLTLTITDEDSYKNTFDIAHNQSGQWRLGDDANDTINVIEMANLSEDEYIVVGNEEYGHLLKVSEIYDDSGTTPGNDRIKFIDVSGDGTTLAARSPTTEGTTTLDLDGKEYTLTYNQSGDDGWVTVKYPAGDSANANTIVVYPTIQTKDGARVAIYEPLTIDLSGPGGTTSDVGTLNFPDGDGYTGVAVDYVGGGTTYSWTFDSARISTGNATTNYTAITIGRLVYNFTDAGLGYNQTRIYVTNPEAGQANIDQPGLIIFEGKDDSNNYEAFVVDLESDPAGTSDNGVGVSDVLFSSPTHFEATMQSNSDISKHVDWWGTLVTVDASESDQQTVEIAYPSSQVYAQLFIGATGSSVTGGTTTTGGTSLGDVLVMDNEISSVSTKNLIVVGGSCINTVAADLIGEPACGSDWTAATGVGSGEFLIQSFGSSEQSVTSKIALLVAGYAAADTTNAGKYLTTKSPETEAGKKYKGTSSTSAELVVSS